MAAWEFEDAQLHRILGSPTRLRILRNLLGKELSVGSLAAAAHLSPQNTSQHLRLMQDKGFLTSRREGQNIFYRIADEAAMRRCLFFGRMSAPSKRGSTPSQKERFHDHNL